MRWLGLVILVLVVALGLARLFSGPEDAWVKDGSGRWVAHGHPAGPPPFDGSAQPTAERVLPWIFFGVVILALAGGAFLSARSPATRLDLGGSIHFFGMVSIVSLALAVALTVALGATVAAGACCGAVDLSNMTLLVLAGLLGLLALLVLVGVYAYGTKKVLEAHYDLKRAVALLQDTMELAARPRPRAGAG